MHDKEAFDKWQASSTEILSRIAVKCLVTNVEQRYNKCKIGEKTKTEEYRKGRKIKAFF